MSHLIKIYAVCKKISYFGLWYLCMKHQKILGLRSLVKRALVVETIGSQKKSLLGQFIWEFSVCFCREINLSMRFTDL